MHSCAQLNNSDTYSQLPRNDERHDLQVKDLHSWVVGQYFQRKGLEGCSPEQLHTVLHALEEDDRVMISNDDNELQIRFVL